ncbi:MAG: hypothetical protein SGBAC_008457 [Bacillariaceae sp.]
MRAWSYSHLFASLFWLVSNLLVSATTASQYSPAAAAAAAAYEQQQQQQQQQQRLDPTIRAHATEEALTLALMDKNNEALDCGMRRLMLKAAKRAVPWRKDMLDVYQALELETRCHGQEEMETQEEEEEESPSSSSSSSSSSSVSYVRRQLSQDDSSSLLLQDPLRSSSPSLDPSEFTVHVCPTDGDDDSQEGSEKRPFASFERALEATRTFTQDFMQKMASSNNNDNLSNLSNLNNVGPIPNRTIILHEGIHYLGHTVVLTPMDSNLTIRNAPGDDAWFSGGKLIQPADVDWTRTEANENIWMASLARTKIEEVTGLFTLKEQDHHHQRMTLARFPNADVEAWDHPNRYVSRNDVSEWILPPFGNVPEFYSIDLTKPDNPTGHVKNDSIMDQYNSYGTGQGGACATVWGDEPSYWCSNLAGGGWAEVDKAAALAGRMNIPRGMILNSNNDNNNDNNNNNNKEASEIFQRAKTWKDPKGAIVHAAHTQGWSWHMFNISNVLHNETSVTIQFDKGGSQGGRNWQCKDSKGHLTDCDGDDKMLDGGDFYVEGILEELDVPGEFYFDKNTKHLYFYPTKNCTDGTADDDDDNDNDSNHHRMQTSCFPPDLVASNLQTMIKIEGTMEVPVRNIKIQGIGFRDAAKTYMEQWSAPSGGDWALHRGGAIHLEGTENVTIVDSKFLRLDGNAIMLGGYCHGTHISRSEFSWIGNGAIATWGDTDGYDATAPSQPRHTVVFQNVMSNLGLYQKQSSGFGQNKACLNTVIDNVMFNLPRAAINFNDGLGGGNMIRGNIIFNACRESGDHGPINSWDRMPFLTNTAGTEPSFTPLPTRTTKNFILANYGASEGFDNDDGSSWYYTYDNVFYAADGFKMDYGGHDSRFYGNLVYATNKHCFGTGSFHKDHADQFFNNTCIIVSTRNPPDSRVGTLYQCSTEGMNPTHNRYLTPSGNATWSCLPHSELFTLAEMQNMGFEANSSVGTMPDAESIISMAKQILEMETL